MKKSLFLLFSSVLSILIVSCNGFQDAYKYAVVVAVHYFSDMNFAMNYPGVQTKVSGNLFEAGDTVGIYVTKYSESEMPYHFNMLVIMQIILLQFILERSGSRINCSNIICMITSILKW